MPGNPHGRHGVSLTPGVDRKYPVEENEEMDISDSEVLDEITTSRGELKLRSVSFDEKFVQVFPEDEEQPRDS